MDNNIKIRDLRKIFELDRISDSDDADYVLEPEYKQQSVSLIQEAMNRGFDVVQLANGDILASGQQIVTFHYSWDEVTKEMKCISTNAEPLKIKGSGEFIGAASLRRKNREE